MSQEFVKQDTALESMRESDFDCYSAYGEAIDNSIQAKANDIRIKFIPKGGSPGQIGELLFADNGTGMDKSLLHCCLKLGHSSRYNDRNGIGRFGVGMTLGAIHECRRIEVYSKTENNEWLWTYIDLDDIKSGKLEYIPEPIEKNPTKEHGNFTDFITESGTLIVWRKYDRLRDRLSNIIEETKLWIGRTFRRFIWGTAKDFNYKINISVDGDKVKPFDPLFVNKELTGFDDEDKADLLPAQKIPWSISKEVRNENPNLGANSNITVNISLLPDSYRRKKGMGGDDFAVKRGFNRNEGVSIMRSDREVFFGHIPYATRLNGSGEGDRNLTRFIGCVIDFTPVLDRAFEVKNIKRGCVPDQDLKKELIEKLAPTFKTLRDKIRNRWSEIEREESETIDDENGNSGVKTGHSATIKIIKKTVKDKIKGSKMTSDEEDNKSISKKINSKVSEDSINQLIEQLKENGITIVDREFIGDSFIDIEHGNNLKTLIYNTNSAFYKSYSRILNQLREKNHELASDYKILIDLIFTGYLMAESKIDPNQTMQGIDYVNDMRLYWSRELRDILKGWE